MKFIQTIAAAAFCLLLTSVAMAQSVTSPSQTTILIRTDEPALLSVDGNSIGMAQAYTPLETPVLPGNHLVTATAVAGSARSDQSVQAAPGQRAIVLFELFKARSQQQQLTQDQQQKTDLAQQKQQCRDQLQAKQAAYNDAVQKYTWELQQAAQSTQSAQLSSMQQGGPQWLQSLNGVMAGAQQTMAATHQKNAALLKVQVDNLRQEISDLRRCAGL